MVPDVFAGIRSRMTPNPAQQQSITIEAAASLVPSRGRKRRSSSFDFVAAKQNIAHRKSSSFDNGGLGLQQSKPEAFLGSYSRLGHGLSGGDSGMAGAGARELQVIASSTFSYHPVRVRSLAPDKIQKKVPSCFPFSTSPSGYDMGKPWMPTLS